MRCLNALYICTGKCKVLLFCLTFSASDGVDVWHLQLDKAQLDSHVR